MEPLKCLRCDADMEFAGRKQFQLGEESWYGGLVGAMDAMRAESIRMDIFKCPTCGKIEFFEPHPRNLPPPQKKTNWTCSECGTYNLGRIQTCQGCGVTRAWSDQQQKKE